MASSPYLILALKTLMGGIAVLVFAAISQLLRPKSFAGLFAAAPAVAIASVLITYSVGGPAKTTDAGLGMLAGAVAMVACCGLAAIVVRAHGAVAGSAVAWLGWFVVAGGLYVGVVARI